jgi:hypothetical protein
MIRNSLSTLLALLIIGLPGMGLSLLFLYRQKEEWLEKWQPIILFLPLPAGFMVVSIILETLVLLGKLSFTRVIAVSLVFSFCMIPLWLKSIREGLFRRLFCFRRHRWIAAACFFVLLYMSLTAFPFEFIFDTTDCGVYVSSGVHAFKTGSFRFYDNELAGADDDFINSFYQITPPEIYSSAANFHFEGLMGTALFIRSLETGLIEPRYFNLHPLWIGLFVNIYGLTPGVWLATPFLALCGISGIFLLSWVLAGRLASVATTGLLSVFVLQIWFGRYITTEMAFQASVMNGLAWLLMFTRQETSNHLKSNLVPIAASGIMLGLSHFSRIDSVLVIPSLFSAGLIWIVFHKKLIQGLWFLSGYGLVTSIAVVTAAVIAHCYTLETLQHVDVDSITNAQLYLFAGSIMAVILLSLRLRSRSDLMEQFFVKRGSAIRILLVVILCLGFLFGYFIRPVLTPPDYEAFQAADPTARSKAFPEMTLRWLGWYMSMPVLIAAFAGLSLLFYRKWSVLTAPVFLVFGFYCLYFLSALRCTPYHYWGMRRFVPVVIPALFIGIGYMFQQMVMWCLKHRKRFVLTLIVAAYLSAAAFFARDLHFITGLVHWKGAVDTLETIDSVVPDDSRLIVSSYPGCYVYVPLKLIFDKNVYKMQKSADPAVVTGIIRRWLESGERVFVLTDIKPQHEITCEFNVHPVLEEKPVYPRMEYFIESKPYRRSSHQIHYHILELTKPNRPAGKDDPA